MEINMNFNIIARCKVVSFDDKEEYKEDLELNFNKEDASNFLFSFTPSRFKYDKYKVILHYNHQDMNLIGITMDDMSKKKKYIILNLDQFLVELYQGYTRSIILGKFSDILEFDFKAGIDIQKNSDVEDEF